MDTATPILQTDASDYGIGGYLFMVTAGIGQSTRWSTAKLPSPRERVLRHFYGVRLFEDLLDNRPFILKTDHMKLTYLNVTLIGKVLR